MFFALFVHVVITGIIWAFVIGFWLLSNASYESKAVQFGVLAILVLPFILDAPALILLLKNGRLRELLS